MDKLQYDSFYKFIVSLGTALITLPVLGFYFFVTDQFIPLITSEEIESLSPASQEMLNKQFQIFEEIYNISPFFLLISIVIGLALIVYGGIKWRSIQIELDAQVKLDTKTKQVTLTQMTPTEIASKVINEVSEQHEVNKIENSNITSISQKEYIQKYFDIENRAFKYIKNSLSRTYKITQNVRVGSCEYDFVATSKQSSADQLYEIKYLRSSQSMSYVSKTISNLNKSGIAYGESTQRNYQMNLIIVCPSPHVDINKELYSRFLNNNKYQFISCIVISEDDI
ncbi:MAG: hypothetical protein RR444_12190 [Oscillospiraceae bacterium]